MSYILLKCAMTNDCESPISHMDEKGFIYCEHHGKQRQHWMRCRKLTDMELARIKAGNMLASYEIRNAGIIERRAT